MVSICGPGAVSKSRAEATCTDPPMLTLKGVPAGARAYVHVAVVGRTVKITVPVAVFSGTFTVLLPSGRGDVTTGDPEKNGRVFKLLDLIRIIRRHVFC